MATPQESVTTVSGRRCTRSRVRTAAPSIVTSEVAQVVSTEPPAQQIQTSAAIEASPPPPLPPPSSTQGDAATTAAASSPIDTGSPALSSAPRPAPLANVVNSPLIGEVPTPVPPVIATPTAAVAPTVVNDPVVAETTAPAPAPAIAPTSSDSIDIAAISTPPAIAISSAPVASAAPAVSVVQSAVAPTSEEPTSSVIPSDPLPTDPPSADPAGDPPTNNQPNEPQPSPSGVPPGGSAGIISPEQGNGDGPGLTIAGSTGANIGGIVGGVVGGLLGLILICGLLFFCLRKRRSREPFERWRQKISEKDQGSPGFSEKLHAIPASIGLFFAKIKMKKTGPTQHPYRNQSARSSLSSVYSAQTNGQHSRSVSEPPAGLRQQLRIIRGRMKRSKTLFQKNQDGFVVGSKSPFKGIVQDPVARNNKGIDNPFVDPDPEPLEPTRNLFVLNPDPNSRESSPNLQREFLVGLRDQQRAPIAPKPAALSDRGSGDPLASIMGQLGEYDGSGTPEWLRDPHKRSHSASMALASHPPSAMYTPSVYTSADNPFLDPSDVPPVPSQPLPPNPPVRPTNAYPTFNPTASDISRASNSSFYFGEPGPSRPATKMFAAPPRKPGRQSDPFDLDRPEVLGFGNVSGRREVRASTVTRQNSRRRSSAPNWINMQDSPYERSSAVPGPLSNPSIKR